MRLKLLTLLQELDLPKNKWTQIPASELKNYDEEILDLISTAYAYIGGHPNYKKPGDINSQSDFIAIDLDDDPDIDAISISKKRKPGTKFTGTGHDGNKKAKKEVLLHKIKSLKTPGFYVEVSGKPETIFKKAGIEVIDDKEKVEQVLQGKEIEWLGDGKYKRTIGGKETIKTLMGKPALK